MMIYTNVLLVDKFLPAKILSNMVTNGVIHAGNESTLHYQETDSIKTNGDYNYEQ